MRFSALDSAPVRAGGSVAGALALLHPGHVDLGLGRSGGSDPATDVALRRTVAEYDTFDDDVRETVHHLDRLGGDGVIGADGVEVFVLGASRATAVLAAREGLGLAVAGHIAPAGLGAAVAAYREHFQACPSGVGPYVVACLPVVVAGSDDEARWWFRSVQQRYLDRLRTGGAPMRPPDDVELDWSAGERYRVDAMLEAAVVGSDETVRGLLREVHRRLAPDEVMAMTDLPDPDATLRSFARLAGVLADTAAPVGAVGAATGGRA